MMRVTDGRSSASGNIGPRAWNQKGSSMAGQHSFPINLDGFVTYFRFILRTGYEPRSQDGWREVKAGFLKMQSLKLGAE